MVRQMSRMFLYVMLALLVAACGGGGGSGHGGEGPVGTPGSDGVNCATSATTGVPYVCLVPSLTSTTTFTLITGPEGVVIQPRSGVLHWTPTSSQTGVSTLRIRRTAAATQTEDTFEVTVGLGAADPAGLYVSPLGNDSAAGTGAAPLATVHEAARRAVPGQTIFLRGGTYSNTGYGTSYSGRSSNYARITNSGTNGSPITIRAWGNEYPRILSDVNAIVFSGAQHWQVMGLELEGNAPSIDRAKTLSLWWNTGEAGNEIQGRGIAMNSSTHITISNCVIHDFPGAGVSNNGGADITVENNVLYGNARWSTSGTHGFANSSPVGDSTSQITIRGNLVFGNQSSMISHVFSKGVVRLEVDEGNGLHMQNNGGTFAGTFIVEHNLALLNGKAGLGLNTVDHGLIRKNAFYQNARAVAGAGEITIQSSNSDSIVDNLFHPAADRRIIRDFQGTYVGVGTNYATNQSSDTDLPSQIQRITAVFADPVIGDFRRASGIPNGQGPSDAALARFRQQIAEFGLRPAAALETVTEAYVAELRNTILAGWPAPDTPDVDGVPNDLVLEDPSRDRCYTFGTRSQYPNGPACP